MLALKTQNMRVIDGISQGESLINNKCGICEITHLTEFQIAYEEIAFAL
jgi:hypothetical protein